MIDQRDLFNRVWGQDDASKFMNLLELNHLADIHFELNEGIAHPYYSPGQIHCSTAHLKQKWPVLHELGHAMRGKDKNLYNLWLCKDFDGRPIPFNEAVKKLLEEEKVATDFANEQIELYGLNIRPRHFDYPPEIILSILWDIKKKGLQSVDQVIQHINDVASSPNPLSSKQQPQQQQQQLFPDKPLKTDKKLDQGWDNALDKDD